MHDLTSVKFHWISDDLDVIGHQCIYPVTIRTGNLSNRLDLRAEPTILKLNNSEIRWVGDKAISSRPRSRGDYIGIVPSLVGYLSFIIRWHKQELLKIPIGSITPLVHAVTCSQDQPC